MFEQEQNDMECSDVEFKFSDGTILYAHRIILFSRCDFYRTMMTGSWKESQPPHKVEEESDPRIFKEFIRYLYCGKVYINAVEDLMLLYSIAEAKCHSSLLVWLSRTIQEHTTAENGCKLLQMLWDSCDRTTQCFRDTFNFIKDEILENIDSFKENRVCELEQEVTKINNIIFRFNVDAIGTSIEEISDAKWRCVIPYDVPKKTIYLKFRYNSRSFEFQFLQEIESYLALIFKK
ncbi:hypothetical protein AKO1_007570 [Acrasis kona]|uniref:BTB domain-containing protein n=1 Tax=Acrasis kona TaxID=1008807 RepID=A0AAW2YPQ6_9EUKA